MIQSVIQLERL